MTRLAAPVFAGKLSIAPASAPSTWVLATSEADPYTLVSFVPGSATTAPRWTCYDAGDGQFYLAFEDGRWLSHVPASGILNLSDDANRALAVKLDGIPGTSGETNTGTWTVWLESKQAWVAVAYTLAGGNPVLTLVAQSTLSGGDSDSFAMTLVTPSLASIQSAGSGAGYDLAGVDLSDADLSGIDLSGTKLAGAWLDGVNLGSATLSGAVLDDTDLTRVGSWGTSIQAPSASFVRCIARGVVIPSLSAAKPVDFSGANFSGADFSGADLTHANLSGADLSGANFAGFILGAGSLAAVTGGENLGGVGVVLAGAYLVDANLREAHLEGATLSGIQAYFTSQGSFDGAFLTGANLSHADLTGMSMVSVELAGAVLDGAVLIDCQFGGVSFVPSTSGSSVSMIGAQLIGASFDSTCVFDRLVLSGAQLAQAQGVPLFSTPIGDDAATLDQGQLPPGFVQLFADHGVVLSSSASVRTTHPDSAWTLRQDPNQSTLGVELTGFALHSDGTTLSVYGDRIALVEQGQGRTSYRMTLGVTATTLALDQLDGGTQLPSGAMVATATALEMSDFDALAVPRVALPS